MTHKEFIEEWGQSSEELALALSEIERCEIEPDEVELFINLGYVYIAVYDKWVLKSHMFYEEEDELVLEELLRDE